MINVGNTRSPTTSITTWSRCSRRSGGDWAFHRRQRADSSRFGWPSAFSILFPQADPDILDRVMEQQAKGITQEVDKLKAEAERLAEEIAELSSEDGPVMM